MQKTNLRSKFFNIFAEVKNSANLTSCKQLFEYNNDEKIGLTYIIYLIMKTHNTKYVVDPFD